MSRGRLLAFYLPQFHPIAENDRWFGRGFTEWTSVTRAKPLFRGHDQPRLPADLGFYDLRLPETRQAQADLARAAGIEGFCYYHYWFAGRRVLERPFTEVLGSGKPDFPFCLIWANVDWTAVWIGDRNRVLVAQEYLGPAEEEAHFRFLLSAFRDPRYIRVEGKPLFIVFRPDKLPDAAGLLAHWRSLACQCGLPGIFAVGFATDDSATIPAGFDGVILHARVGAQTLEMDRCRSAAGRRWVRMRRRLTGIPRVYRYDEYCRLYRFTGEETVHQYPCVVPNWDNTPRYGSRGFVLQGSTPALFRVQLDQTLHRVADRPDEHRLVFIKSWNEWAEGNYLEPDRRYGMAYLDAVRECVDK